MANVPAYKTANFSFGPGIVYLGPVNGTTPTIDIGAVKGDAELSIVRTPLQVFQGSPQTLVKQYVIKEEVSLRFTGVEWNMDQLPYIVSAGITSVSGAADSLHFGGDTNILERSLRYLHILPDGSTMDLHMFRVQGAGELAIALKETDIHEFPFEFRALEGTTDFANAVLLVNRKLFKIIRTRI